MTMAAIGHAAFKIGSAFAQTAINQHNAKKMLDYQNKANLKNWKAENAYNSPSAQMARIKAAGLNPNLIYSSSNPVGSSGSIPAPSASAPEMNIQPDVVNDYTSLVHSQNETDSVASQIGLMAAQKVLTTLQSENTERQNAKLDTESQYWHENAYSQALQQYFGARAAFKQLSVLDETAKNLASQTDVNNQNVKNLQKQLQLSDAQMAQIRANIRKCDTEIEQMYFLAGLKSMEFNLTAAEKDVYIKTLNQTLEKLKNENDANSWLAARYRGLTDDLQGKNGFAAKCSAKIIQALYNLSDLLPFKGF